MVGMVVKRGNVDQLLVRRMPDRVIHGQDIALAGQSGRLAIVKHPAVQHPAATPLHFALGIGEALGREAAASDE
jgi:hypothetical protein